MIAATGFRCRAAVMALCLVTTAPLHAEVAEGLKADGGSYTYTASAVGSSAQEAVDKARGAALLGLFAGLSKDRLYAEVFTASPPLGLSFKIVDTKKSPGSYSALVILAVDDESLRIVENGPYLAAALALLDKAESSSDEAEARRAEAASAESAADLGAALRLYGMSTEACRSALDLVDPLADPSIFSQKGKRTAPELKKSLAATLNLASAGIDRVVKAQSALAADASSAAAGEMADAAMAAADTATAFLEEAAPILDELGTVDAEKLATLRDGLAAQRRAIADSLLALGRADASLHPAGPAPNEPGSSSAKGSSFADVKLDFAKRRLASVDASLAAAYGRVDRELRDPVARRAARARAVKWALLHAPRELASLRAYLPFDVATGEGGIYSAPFAARASFEGAFPLGQGGVWLRSPVEYAKQELKSGEDESFLTQSFDFGVWGKRLYFVGYRWDWLRHVGGESIPKAGAFELGMGGVYGHGNGSAEERFHRADWTLALSYELPYNSNDTRFWSLVNAGLDARFRLGDLAIFEVSLSKRLEEEPGSLYDSVLSWAVALGVRLPPPFTIGAEYRGSYVQSLLDNGDLGEATGFDGGRFRFFLQYSL